MTKLTIDGPLAAGTYTLVVGDPVPTPTPTPPPPPGSGGADKVWDLQVTGLFPQPIPTADGDRGYSLEFVANGTKYPYGVFLQFLDESGEPKPKEMVVSLSAHDFNALPNGRATGTTGGLDLRYSTSANPSQPSDCELIDKGTYYINVRDANIPRGRVNFQVSATQRTAISAPPPGRADAPQMPMGMGSGR